MVIKTIGIAMAAISTIISSCQINIYENNGGGRENNDYKKVTTHVVEVDDFTAIDASVADVTFVYGDKNKVEYTVSNSISDKVKISTKNGELNISVKKKSNKEIFECVVTGKMPIKDIETSASCDFILKGDVIADKVTLEASSASIITIDGEIIADDVKIDVSSSAIINVNKVKSKSIKADASSASILNIGGETQVAEYESGSAANIYAKNMIAGRVKADASSASYIEATSTGEVYKTSGSGAKIDIIRK